VFEQREILLSDTAVVDLLDIEFDATVRSEAGWQRLIAKRVAAAPEGEGHIAWHAMLAEAGLDEAHSEVFARAYRQHVYPSWQYLPDAPELLSSTLPGSGRWEKVDGPAPLP
jgi:hypothetical protein